MSKIQTEDITPTWEALLPLLLRYVGDNESAMYMEDEVSAELLKMARAADKWNQHCKEMEQAN